MQRVAYFRRLAIPPPATVTAASQPQSGGAVPLGAITATIREPGGGTPSGTITVHWAVTIARIEPVAYHCEAGNGAAPLLGSDALEKLTEGAWHAGRRLGMRDLAAATAAAALPWLDWLDPQAAHAIRTALPRSATRKQPPGRPRGYSTGHLALLREIAAVYDSAHAATTAAGSRPKPAKAVHAAYGDRYDPRTIARYIAQARESGYITAPAPRGGRPGKRQAAGGQG